MRLRTLWLGAVVVLMAPAFTMITYGKKTLVASTNTNDQRFTTHTPMDSPFELEFRARKSPDNVRYPHHAIYGYAIAGGCHRRTNQRLYPGGRQLPACVSVCDSEVAVYIASQGP